MHVGNLLILAHLSFKAAAFRLSTAELFVDDSSARGGTRCRPALYKEGRLQQPKEFRVRDDRPGHGDDKCGWAALRQS